MKKRFLSTLLAIVMLLSLLPTTVFAEGKISNVTDLKAAISAGTSEITISGTITLDESIEIPADKTITIQGASRDSDKIAVSGTYTVLVKGNLTLKNLTIEGAMTKGYGVITVGADSAELHTDNVTISNTTTDGTDDFASAAQGIQVASDSKTYDNAPKGVTIDLKNSVLAMNAAAARGISFGESTTGQTSEVILDNTVVRNGANWETQWLGGNSRGLNIPPNTVSTVEIKNGSKVMGWQYAFNAPGDGTGANVTVDNSTIMGWTTFNIWSDNATITVKNNSTLIGTNGQYNNDQMYGFSAFVFNDDIYGYGNPTAKNNKLVIENSTVKAETSYETSPVETFIRIDEESNTVQLNGTVTFLDTTGGAAGAIFNIGNMSDPVAYMEEHASLDDNATVITPNGNSLWPVYEVKNTYYYNSAECVSYGEFFKTFIAGVDYADAAASQEKVILLVDVDASDFAVNGEKGHGNQYGGWTLDLAGHVLNVAEWDADKVTVIDSSPDKTGDILVDGVSMIYNRTDEICNMTLANAIVAAQPGDTIKLPTDVDLIEPITIDKNLKINLNNHTITGNDVRVFNVKAGTLTLDGTGIVTSVKPVSGTLNAASSVIRVGNNEGENLNAVLVVGKNVTISAPNTYGVAVFGSKTTETVTIYGKVQATGDASALSGNGSEGYGNTTINIESGALISAANNVAIYHPQSGKLNINGGTITGTGGIEVKAGDTAISIGGDPTITATGEIKHTENNNGTSTSGYAISVVENKNYSGGAQVSIKSGYYAGDIKIVRDNDITEDKKGEIIISGGYFTSDPTAYCVDGKTGVANTDSATKAQYPFTVGEKKVDVETSVSAGEPKASVGITDSKVTEDTVKAAANDTATQTSLQEAATIAGLTNDENVVGSKDEVSTILNNNGVSNTGDNVTVFVQPYLDVNVKEATSDDDRTMTVEIEAKYNVVATTATDPAYIKLQDTSEGSNDKNAVALASGQPMEVDYPVTIKLPLPTGFVDSTSRDVYIRHVKANGTVYVYKANVSEESGTYYATFVNPNGFSTFILTTSTAASITVDETTTYYDTLQAAVDAVSNGQTINVLTAGQTATVSRTVKFTVTGETCTINLGTNYTDQDASADVFDVVYTAPTEPTEPTTPSTGGGGGGGSTTYSVTAPTSTKNGSVTVSPKSASKGKTVTITVKPDAGYELDKLTVTDKNGNSVTLTRKSDTQYTFTMPASKVEITAVFAEIPQTDPCDGFDDLDHNAWYHDAVNYVLTKGMMSGVSDDEFAPNATLTRAMVVQILWAVEGKPQVNYAMNYGDVSQSDWYAEAVRWAASQGIASGVADGSFAPGASITREQLMTMLYAYAQKKGEGFTGSWMFQLDFADQSQVSSWAYEPACWCTMNGVVSGKDGGRLDPVGTATRAEAAQMLMKFCQTLGE